MIPEIRQKLVARRIVLAAERAAVMRPPAQTRDSDRRVHRAAAADDDELVRDRLAAGRRELRHAKHDVLHGDAGAENRGRVRTAHARAQANRG
jgi:hypothetical protein